MIYLDTMYKFKISVLSFMILSLIILQSSNAQSLQVLHSFNGSDGATSKGSLVLVGNVLYGRTSAGGVNGQGVIFKINTDTTGFQIMYPFTSGSNNIYGNQPHHDAMLAVGSVLYGTALMGGNSNNGVLYKINLSGTGYDTVHMFTGGNNDGAQPHSGVILLGNILYGMTAAGGTHDNGTLYRINPNGTGFSVLYSFHNPTGDQSHGRLLLSSDSTQLLGMTRKGGTSDFGVIFSFTISNSTYTALHTFLGGSNDGNTTDHGFLTRSSDTIFGMTQLGGVSNQGVLFSINQNGNNFQVIHSFGAGNDGAAPYGSLALSNGFLFGTTRNGGANGQGTIFHIRTNGTGYATTYSLSLTTSGSNPIDNVVLSPQGNTLYCLSQSGGIYDPTGNNSYGTIFSITVPGSFGIQTIGSEVPDKFTLSQNYPNPFNPSTKIKFDNPPSPLSERGDRGGFIQLKVYDLLGREIATLVNEQLKPGTYETEWDATNYPSGVYFYTLTASGYSKTMKMILVK